MSDNQLDNIDRKLWDAAGAGDEEALVSQLIDQATVDWRRGYTALQAAHYGPVVTRLLDIC